MADTSDMASSSVLKATAPGKARRANLFMSGSGSQKADTLRSRPSSPHSPDAPMPTTKTFML